MNAKKQSVRMCIVCKGLKNKQDFLRIIRTTEKEVKIDATRKMSGRGSYICIKKECLDKAFKGALLAKALKIDSRKIDKKQLIGEAKRILDENE